MGEILKVLVWPVTVVIAMWTFRSPIAGFLGRLHEVKAKDIQLIATPAQQSEPKILEATLGEHIENRVLPDLAERREEIKQIDVLPIVFEQEQLIKKDIERLKITQPELTDVLIRHLAVIQLAFRAETIYRLIFGSQIDILNALNLFGPRTRDEVILFYENAKIEYPSIATYPFENYLGFLTSHGLMVQGIDGKYAITMAGKEFLKYLIDIKATGKKPF